jgi:N utilization substance protein A
MNGELLRLVDTIHRDKNIDKESVFESIESSIASAARKHYGQEDDVEIRVDRSSGKVTGFLNGKPIKPKDLGRIAAQTAKQVMIQKIREAEGEVIFQEFEQRRNSIVNGFVQRYEGPNLIVNLGRGEGVLPRREQVPTESYHAGDRIRVYVLDVRRIGQKPRIILSRTHPEMVKRLFEMEVPEVAEGIVQVKAIAREAGYRTKIAVESTNAKVDCVGACVGVRGTRIKNIVDELGGEKIDIIRWNDSSEILIVNSLKPAEITEIALDEEKERATVVVAEDQLSLAIGKKGQNVRLASKLAKWDLDIVTEAEAKAAEASQHTPVEDCPGVGPALATALRAAGLETAQEVAAAGFEGVTALEGIGEEKGTAIMEWAVEKMRIKKLDRAAKEGPAGPAVPAAPAAPAEESAETAEEPTEAAEKPTEAGEEPTDRRGRRGRGSGAAGRE